MEALFVKIVWLICFVESLIKFMLLLDQSNGSPNKVNWGEWVTILALIGVSVAGLMSVLLYLGVALSLLAVTTFYMMISLIGPRR